MKRDARVKNMSIIIHPLHVITQSCTQIETYPKVAKGAITPLESTSKQKKYGNYNH